MKLRVIVHPYTSVFEPTSEVIKGYESYLEKDGKKIVFYSPFVEKNTYHQLLKTDLKGLKNKDDVHKIMTHPNCGILTSYGRKKLEKLVLGEEINEVRIIGQTIDFVKHGQCVDGIISELDEILDEKTPFYLDSELLCSYTGFLPRINKKNHAKTSLGHNYDTKRKIELV